MAKINKIKQESRKKTIMSYVLVVVAAAALGYFGVTTLNNTDVDNNFGVTELASTKDPDKLISNVKEYIRRADQSKDTFADLMAQGGPMTEHTVHTNRMSAYDKLAIDTMLAAELQGVDLRETGLVDTLCDSLESQYEILIRLSGKQAPEKDPININERLDNEQSFGVASAEVKTMLDSAMVW